VILQPYCLAAFIPDLVKSLQGPVFQTSDQRHAQRNPDKVRDFQHRRDGPHELVHGWLYKFIMGEIIPSVALISR
jgi:hypothetical protein